ncbi:MAG: heat-inducible transcriptional repressor HrcA [Acidimicrobiales bacterium]
MVDELEPRKASILRVVIDEYVRTAEPVGSQHVASSGDVRASAATIRNDMAALEHEGYLSQPHVSAGRIPTDKGYRYFVDKFQGSESLDSRSSLLLRDFFEHTRGEIEQLLHETSKLLSTLTNYTSVLTAASTKTREIRHVQLVQLSPTLAMAVMVDYTGAIRKNLFDISEPELQGCSDESFERASNLLTRTLRGSIDLDSVELAKTGDPLADQLALLGSRSVLEMVDVDDEELVINEASKVANSFLAVEQVSRVLETLEQQILVVSLMKSIVDRGQTVSIGEENGVDSLIDCALVIAPYEFEGRRVGSIGVIGPTRMNYPLAIAAVQQVSQGIGSRRAEG